jgi:hypothetical protein
MAQPENPTNEQLEIYYQSNNKYFWELATYYHKHDAVFYTNAFIPIIEKYKNIQNTANVTGLPLQNIPQIECPFCHNKIYPKISSHMSTIGIICTIIGVLIGIVALAMLLESRTDSSLGCAFMIGVIALVFFVVGISKKDIMKSCTMCNMRLQ